jgi:polyhydroxyalkanoate synthesis regulator phasin
MAAGALLLPPMQAGGVPAWLAANAMTVLIGLGAAAVLVFSLLGERELWDLDEGEGLLARLRKRRERLLRSLSDLETERDAGKLSEDEFHALRQELKRRAIQASRDLERVRHARLREIEKGRGGPPESRRRRIEELVKKRKVKS